MPFLEEDTFKIIKNTREEWAEWRESSTPVFDAAHSILEVVFVFGWVLRYFAHFVAHAFYLDANDRQPDYSDDDFRFSALVVPILEPVHWRQEALMRATAAGFGVVILSLGINPWIGAGTDPAMVELKFWAAITQGGYLLFDPLLGVAQRIGD